MNKEQQLKELQTIPGVGSRVSQIFWDVDIKKVSSLEGKNPEDLYLKICANLGHQVDRCVLYVCRCSVYFAENKNPDPEKLKWWNWKD